MGIVHAAAGSSKVSENVVRERSWMSQPASERNSDQVARERAAAEVSDVLLNIEHALSRAKKAHKTIGKDAVDINAELALADTVKELERIRKRLTQDTYFASDVRLI